MLGKTEILDTNPTGQRCLCTHHLAFSPGLTHPRLAERGSRQAIQTRPDNSNRVVSPARSFPGNMLQVAPTSNRHFCNKVQQTSPVCITSTRPPGLGCQCTQPAMGGSGSICIPTSIHLGQSGGEILRLPIQENHSDCPEVAQHALVLGSSDHVQPNPTEPGLPAEPAHTTIQSDSTQESVKPKPTCMAPRPSAIKEQGFSEAVAA